MKHIKTLQSKKGRKEHGQFLAEGIRLLEEAYRCKVTPDLLCVADSQVSERGQHLVKQFQRRGVRIEAVSARQMSGLSETRAPQGLVAVFPTPQPYLAELSTHELRRVLLCEGIGDPGNLGTLMRSARAFGFSTMVLLEGCAEAHAPKVVRASAGAVFGLTIVTVTLAGVLTWLEKRSVAVIAADGRGEDSPEQLRSIVATAPVVVALGSEADGLSADLIQCSRLVYRIGHESGVESLNVAVAGSILMKQVYDIS